MAADSVYVPQLPGDVETPRLDPGPKIYRTLVDIAGDKLETGQRTEHRGNQHAQNRHRLCGPIADRTAQQAGHLRTEQRRKYRDRIDHSGRPRRP